MPVIIAATDFSEIADNAVAYACELAIKTSASVLIVHSFIIPVAFSDTPLPVMPIDEGRDIAEERLNEIVKNHQKNFPGLQIQGKVLYGDIVDSLQEYTEEEGTPWAIVLGNSGDEGLWMGSSTVAAVRRFSCKVITVPPQAHFAPVKNICLACDLDKMPEKMPIQEIISLVGTMDATLHVLHITAQPATTVESTDLYKALEPVHPVYHQQTGTDLDQAIIDFVNQNQMDWLMMLPGNHSFLERIFHKSHTKAMIRLSEIPVVALHAER
jgi:nucleotide-binding universal stress UspA family protein